MTDSASAPASAPSEGDSAAPAEGSTSAAFDPSGHFDESGKFGQIGERYASDGVDSDFINRHFAGKTPGEVAQTLKANKSLASQKALAYPGGDASADEVDMWRKGAGVPENAAQILGEDTADFTAATGWQPEMITGVVDAMIAANTPGPSIAAGMEAVQVAAKEQGEAWKASIEAKHDAAVAAFEVKHGAEHEAALQSAVIAAEKVGEKAGLDANQIEVISEAIADLQNPDLTEMFVNISKTIQEAQFRGPGQRDASGEYQTPRAMADSIMNDATHNLHAKYQGGDLAIHRAIDDILGGDATLAKAAAHALGRM